MGGYASARGRRLRTSNEKTRAARGVVYGAAAVRRYILF